MPLHYDGLQQRGSARLQLGGRFIPIDGGRFIVIVTIIVPLIIIVIALGQSGSRQDSRKGKEQENGFQHYWLFR